MLDFTAAGHPGVAGLIARLSLTQTLRGFEQGLLSADGRESLPLPVGSRVVVRSADHRLRMVRREAEETFYRKVRDRFHLPDDRDPGLA